jgi:DNA-binding Lrp family transcriptional regulator
LFPSLGRSLELDDIDKRIIKEYLEDARRSYREIAKRIGVAVGTVLSRLTKLEAAKIIKGYSAIIDYSKLGYDITVVTEVVVSKGMLLEVEKNIAEMPGVCAVYDVTGETDAIVIAKFKNRESLSNFTKSLLKMPYIERTNTHVVLTTAKEDFINLPI